mgnify:CR=1 FL=1|jgi:hypothetical protein
MKISIRTNVGIRMKDGNRSKAGKSGAGLGEKSEIKANAGIRVKDENRSKTGKSGAGLGENRK